MDQITGTSAFLSSCAGKEAFTGRARADKAAKRKPNRTPYRCEHCRLWHVGMNPPKHFDKRYRNNGKRKRT